MNTCDYHLGVPTTLETDTTTANLSITCESGKKILVQGISCKLEIGPQGPLSHVVFHNETGVGDVVATVTITGIEYTMLKGCPKVEGASETRKDGELVETLTVTANNNGNPVPVSVT